jgi:hypothetical protein
VLLLGYSGAALRAVNRHEMDNRQNHDLYLRTYSYMRSLTFMNKDRIIRFTESGEMAKYE